MSVPMTAPGPVEDVDNLVRAKRAFYRRPEIAAGYDQQRFGGTSGAYVNSRELGVVDRLLPSSGVMADVGCGTGRLLPVLRGKARLPIGLDTSLPMLRQAARTGVHQLVEADGFALPLADSACDAVACLRVLFHLPDAAPLLRELRRVTRPGGMLVCDTATLSPRALLPLQRGRWGEHVVTTTRAEFREMAGAAGWRVRAEVPVFLMSPYIYRLLPLGPARQLERMERWLPPRLLCRVFWQLEAIEAPHSPAPEVSSGRGAAAAERPD